MAKSKEEKKRAAAYMKKFREKKLEEGVCPVCCKAPISGGEKKCESCASRSRELAKKRREKSADSGMCTICHKVVATDGLRRCSRCAKKNKENCTDRAEQLKSEGLCPKCGQPAEEGGAVLCSDCKKSQKRHNDRRSKDRLRRGVCVKCGINPHEPGVSRCYDCKMRDNDKSYQKKYGLTLSDVLAILAMQEKKCATCECDIENDYVVDHCHETGRVRGLLCSTCNIQIGHYESFLRRGILDKVNHYILMAGRTNRRFSSVC